MQADPPPPPSSLCPLPRSSFLASMTHCHSNVPGREDTGSEAFTGQHNHYSVLCSDDALQRESFPVRAEGRGQGPAERGQAESKLTPERSSPALLLPLHLHPDSLPSFSAFSGSQSLFLNLISVWLAAKYLASVCDVYSACTGLLISNSRYNKPEKECLLCS